MYNVCITWYNYACYAHYTVVCKCDIIHVDFILYNVLYPGYSRVIKVIQFLPVYIYPRRAWAATGIVVGWFVTRGARGRPRV